ncbi:MAG: 4a-hydroxytetrahydrobiopterin dehydratase [Acidobacteriaceae bacterium]
MPLPVLDDAQLRTFLTDSQWMLDKGELVEIFEFKDFKSAIAFVNQVARLAEDANHHPDIDVRYNKLRLSLVTHDAGGITENDINLAKEIDREFEK